MIWRHDIDGKRREIQSHAIFQASHLYISQVIITQESINIAHMVAHGNKGE